MEIQVGKNIRSLRCKRQVSQEDLAETMGVTVQAISKWETGKANPDLMPLPKLAEYFEVTIDYLFYIHAEYGVKWLLFGDLRNRFFRHVFVKAGDKISVSNGEYLFRIGIK